MRKLKLNLMILIALISITSLISGCSDNAGEPDNAEKITKKLLQSIIDVDFDTYSSCFVEELRPELGNEDDFEATTVQIAEVYGEYIEDTLTYTGTETTDDGYKRVFYDAEFTKAEIIRVVIVFRESEDDKEVIGFFLNPK